MKIATVLGTRPEIIRLSLLISRLDQTCDHVLVHTGQNSDPRLSDVFFGELNVRTPNHFLHVQAPTFAEQTGQILHRVESVLSAERPDRLLLLGDTNSALCAIVAKRLGIPVFHMEAGNRCYDDRVPEEVNRRVVDHCSDVLLPYTERSRDNLLREGIPSFRIFVTGNPINEVMLAHRERCAASAILTDLKLQPRGYFIATMHRAENVDVPARLKGLLAGLDAVGQDHDRSVILSAHPRMRSRIQEFGIEAGPRLRLTSPFGFFDFMRLQTEGFCVISDSGTVQEECAILGVPSVTIRDVTERPETMECGANILAGADPAMLARAVRVATSSPPAWQAPQEYRVTNVSDTVLRILTSHHQFLPGIAQ